MAKSLQLSDKEWQLVLDLLKIEQDELPVEIHHSEHSSYRDELHRRKDMVNAITKRIEDFLGMPAKA